MRERNNTLYVLDATPVSICQLCELIVALLDVTVGFVGSIVPPTQTAAGDEIVEIVGIGLTIIFASTESLQPPAVPNIAL
jgi:hypothetical protein